MNADSFRGQLLLLFSTWGRGTWDPPFRGRSQQGPAELQGTGGALEGGVGGQPAQAGAIPRVGRLGRDIPPHPTRTRSCHFSSAQDLRQGWVPLLETVFKPSQRTQRLAASGLSPRL